MDIFILAQPPLFKVTKANKSVYIKDENAVRGIYFKSSKVDKKIKKGTAEYKNLCRNKEKNYLYNVSRD